MRKLLMTLALLASALLLAVTPNEQSTDRKPFDFETMMKLKRLAEPVPSPDGKWVVFSATDVSLAENTRKSHLWIVPTAGAMRAASMTR